MGEIVLKAMSHLLVLILLFPVSVPATAHIRFEDVTEQAGMVHRGPSFGASWGDFNGDGWPDLWVSNHAEAPSLYLNRGDGTFSDITSAVWSADPTSDTHGAAWADFDNDGDQDLIEVVGAASGTGKGPNHLFVNDGEKLINQAATLGVDYPLGRGRTPLWFDWNGDGLLDVLLLNAKRRGVPSVLFQQTDSSFQDVSRATGLRLTEYWYVRTTQYFAQLSDLSGDGKLDLVVYGQDHSPQRVYNVRTLPFQDLTASLRLPITRWVNDVAIADFNEDLLPDLYLTKSSGGPDAVQVDANTVEASLVVNNTENGITFRTAGEVTLDVYPRGIIEGEQEQTKIFIGSAGHHPTQFPFTLSPQETTVQGIADYQQPCKIPRSWPRYLRRILGFSCTVIYRFIADVPAGIYIGYDRTNQVWRVVHSYPTHRERSVVLETQLPVSDLTPIGFNRPHRPPKGRFLVQGEEGFEDQTVAAGLDAPASCPSVVAGDFDNDMDVDLYLVCRGVIENSPNILYENQGDGTFLAVPGAGGAAGSSLGIGDTVVMADYDRDGFLDLFVTNGAWPPPFYDDGPHQLFRNVGTGNHWLEIDLEGVVSNRDGIGARVLATAGEVTQLREQGGGMHNGAQDHQRIHFGLGSNTRVDRLIAHWPSGIVQEIQNVPADQVLRIVEPSNS